ncbi:MAG: hypothetical protein K6F73_04370 [Lachnospiraceae bacterium]|nr:hypothetical protein [Lachnospiraceae bacterium]
MIKFLKKNYVYICFLICFLLLLWRSFLGFCWTDESFYVSTADRFFRGDVPLVDEWYRTQLSSLIMLPFYALYVLITGGNAGIILYFRILYLVFSASVSAVYFIVLKKERPVYIAGAAALFVMCYAHLNNATFSYYMLSELFLALALILIYDCRRSENMAVLVCSGVFIALSVLSMPAFAIGYVIVLILAAAVLVVSFIRSVPEKIRNMIDGAFIRKALLFTFIGILIPAFIFAAYMMSRADFSRLFETLPYALVDREHSNTFGYYIRKPHRSLMEVYGLWTYCSYILIAICAIFGRWLKKRPFCYFAVLADIVIFAAMAIRSFGHTGYIQAAFFMFMIPVFFISEKKDSALFSLMAVPSVLVALIYCFASSDFLYVMAIGFAISSGAGVCVLYDFAEGNLASSDGNTALKTAVKAGIVIACAYSLCITFYLRIKNVYRDAPIWRLSCAIQEGVAKGLYTTKEHLELYNDVCSVIDEYLSDTEHFEIISGNPDGNVLFSKILPWGYAASSLDCGYPTTWRATAYDEEQLEKYYGINTDAVPDVIIVLDSVYGSYDAAGDTEDDHIPNLDEMSGYWKDYIAKNGFTETPVKCGKLYCRPKK